MAHWTILTTPATHGGALTGQFSDVDRRFRLSVFADQLIRAEAALTQAQRVFDAEVTAARAQDQDALANEAVRRLAERRGAR